MRLHTRQLSFLSNLLLVGVLVALMGCSRPELPRGEVRSAVIEARSYNPDTNARWQATNAEIDALVAAVNDSRPFREEAGTTPRVLIVMELRDGSTVRLLPTSQGFHYFDRAGESAMIQGDLLDEQFDYRDAKAGRIGQRVQ